MSETTDARANRERTLRDLRAELESASGANEAYARVCSILEERFDHYAWVGIYLVEGGDLVLAAWSGPEATEHVRIPVGAGICGLAAATGETEVVPDVSERPEFIACFPSTRSEIVVPIRASDGRVIGEIDIDSDDLDAFGDDDRAFLEMLAGELAAVAEREA